jgi:hypothetical protein
VARNCGSVAGSDECVEAGDAELDKRLEQCLVEVVAGSEMTSHDYTAAVCARQ